MNSEIKTRWLEALRSGNYTQTQHRLRDKNGFCCWGVLCDIIEPEGWEDVGAFQSHSNNVAMPPLPILMKAGIEVDDSSLLPILMKAGIEVDDPSLGHEEDSPAGAAGDLAGMNDSKKNFAEIADYIERHM